MIDYHRWLKAGKKILKNEYFYLSVILIYHLICHLIWVVNDTRPQAWDGSHHLNLSLDYIEAFKKGSIWEFLGVSKFYPPLFHLAVIPFLFISNFNPDIVVIPNWICLCILVFSTYGIGKIIFKEKRVAVFGAVIVSFYPFVNHLISREVLIDLSIASMIAAGIYFLLKSNNFNDIFSTRMFFAVSFFGLLIKWNYGIYLFAPVLVMFLRSNLQCKKRFVLYSLAVFVALMPVYGCNILPMTGKIIHFMNIGAAEGDPSVLSFNSILWYTLALGQQIYLLPTILFFAGLSLIFINIKKEYWILFVWILVPYIIHTLISNKDLRYTVPLLPAVALISAFPFSFIKSKKVLAACVSAGIAVLFIQLFHFDFGISGLKPGVHFNLLGMPMVLYNKSAPQGFDWRHLDILEYIQSQRKKTGKIIVATVLSNHPYLHGSTLRYTFRTHSKNIFAGGFSKRLGELKDFIILKTGSRGPEFTLGAIESAVQNMGSMDNYFSEAISFDLPDNSKAIIYKQELKPWEGNELDSLNMHIDTLKCRGYVANDVRITFVNYPGESWNGGSFKSIVMDIGEMNIKGFIIKDAKIILNGASISLEKLIKSNELFLLSLEEMVPHIYIAEEFLRKFIIKKARHLENVSIIFSSGIEVKGRYRFIPVDIKVSIDKDGDYLKAGVSKIAAFFIGIPRIFYKSYLSGKYSLNGSMGMPFRVKIDAIEFTQKGIAIN
ncbi:MAG: hypothetical protein ABII27_00195 [bacterium]